MPVRVRATATPVGGDWPEGATVTFDWGDRSEPTELVAPANSAEHVYQTHRLYTVRAQAYTRGGMKIGGPGSATFNASAPVLTGITPGFGPETGGTPCVIDGANLAAPVMAVLFGPNQAANLQLLSSTAISCTAPAGSGLVNVQAVAPVGTNAVQYEYRPATVARKRAK